MNHSTKAVVVALLSLLFAWAITHVLKRSPLESYESLKLVEPAISNDSLRVTFLGTTTILFEDGETAILIDGFFSRPSLLSSLFNQISPNAQEIEHALKRVEISSLAAVLTTHSHYDHAMDAPFVAKRTGALLIGSESTANIGRGAGLPEQQIKVLHNLTEVLSFGRFEITFIISAHSPNPIAPGFIEKPLSPPAYVSDYKLGEVYSVMIKHDQKKMLVQGSAGYVEGALQGQQADVVFFGIGTLSKQTQEFKSAYWREVIQTVQAKRVIPVHWDDFSISLQKPLLPFPNFLDNFQQSMQFLLEHQQENIQINLIDAWIKIDPFYGL